MGPARKEAPAERVAQLVDDLNRYSRRYYVDGISEVSDKVYDELFRELQRLEEEHPELVRPDSPTRRVGEPIPEGRGFDKVVHRVPMLSIESLFDREEVDEFVERIARFLGLADAEELAWQVEPKFDGISAALHYERGLFVRGVTRGDGHVGEDVTANLRTVRNIPLRLAGTTRRPVPDELEVRGEVLIAREAFARFNRAREAAGETILANPRNAAAGAIRRNDPAEVARYPLEFHLYAAPGLEARGSGFATHEEVLAALNEWGLVGSDLRRRVLGVEAAVAYHDELEERRESLAFEVDGVVCKLDRLDLRQRLGSTARATRWQFAHKFAAVEAVSTLRAIEVQVGANGRLTPRAHVEPVEVTGVVVRHATLHNADHVRALGVRVGDQVFVRRAGDVIPQITGVAAPARGRAPTDWAQRLPESLAPRPGEAGPRRGVMTGWREEFRMPAECPSCGTPVVVEGKYVRCPNLYRCRPQVVGRTLLLSGRGGFEIDSIGEKMVEQLVDAGYLQGPADLFHLDPEKLVELERWGRKTVDNLMGQLEERRHVPFARFLASLAIPDVGGATGRLLAQTYSSLEELMAADEEELQHIDGIGPEVAAKVVRWFADERNRAFLQRLFDGGVEIRYPARGEAGGAFEGKTVVFTGTLEGMTRAEAKKVVEDAGGRVVSSVSSRTDFLVQGGKPGSKARKAQELGVTVLLEADFLERIRGG